MDERATLKPYERFDFTDPDKRWTRPVYKRGSGPAVIVIHEMPGLHPLVIRFADRVAAAGMTVYCPVLFGQPGRDIDAGYAAGVMLGAICIRREFNIWSSGKTSPMVEWLRALARRAHAECGGAGVGAVGMCFTGGFALAMMTDSAVVAPVLSQPSLPLGGAGRKGGIDIAPADLACVKQRLSDEDLTVLGLRFHDDDFVPDARFEAYRAALGPRFEAIELDPKDARRDKRMRQPHSVLTVHLKDDDPAGPTKQAERRVIEFLRARTAP